MRPGRLILAVLACLCFGGAAVAEAQIRSVRLLAPRPYGWFLGDRIRHEVLVEVEAPYTLQRAALPVPGPREYWLDLTAMRVEEQAGQGVTRYRLLLDYQAFYAALETRRLKIPGFAITAADGDRTVEAQVPPWDFLVSPLREIQPPPEAEPADYLRPDDLPAPRDTRPVLRWTIGLAAGLVPAVALLAWQRGWPPFRARPGRPFSGAARRLAVLARQGGDAAVHRQALLVLHRAFDAAAGRRLLAEDLPAYLAQRPGLGRLEGEIGRFFAVSRRAFFGDDAAAATALPTAEILALAHGLARTERRGP